VVSGKTVELAELRTLVQRQIERLAAADPRGLTLMVRADRDARSDDLNRVVTMLHDQGVGTIRIATETPI
jgi:biopolymer transport protein ExbD